MSSSKAIDISKSSLVGLKAELLRKQEEVKKIKELHKDAVKLAPKQKKVLRVNKGIEERNLKDLEQTEDDSDMLLKSRQLLEAKARLYDKLKVSEGGGNSKTQYLIDFDLKQEIYATEKVPTVENTNISQLSEDENGYSDSNSDPENDWVDFVDALGRSRRCLKKDLPEMKIKDDKLAASLRPPSPPPVAEVTPELLSWDMQREMLRKKWEEQETKLLGKKDIHYQDVLFDEARPHGVGYFGFSTEESERLRQQQELQNMRKETLEQQDAAVGLRVRRQQQLEARLAAARRRKRERLGLPPEDPKPLEPEINVSKAEEEQNQQNSERIEDIEEDIKKIAPIRPWDIGKLDVVMSQEEWVEKKRSERLQEFAPPPSLLQLPRSAIVDSKNENKHDFKYFNHNSFSGHTGHSLKVPETANFFSNTHSFHNLSKKESFTFKNNTQQFNCDNTNKNITENSITNIEEYHSKINNTETTSKGIEGLLSKTKEKNDSHNVRRDSSSREVISCKEDFCNSTSDSLKVTRDRNSDIFGKKTNASNVTPTISQKVNKDILRPEKYLEVTEKSVQGRIIESNNTRDSLEGPLSSKRKWAEIPPPTSMSYYNDGASSSKQHTSSKSDLLESISVGLNFLKAKEKKKTRVKGLLDIF